MNRFIIGTLMTLAMLIAPAGANTLKTGPLPMCGLDDAAFRQLQAGIRQQSAWQGIWMDRGGVRSGVLELTIGRTGGWSLFFRFVGADGNQRVCLVSRGVGSQAKFGRPM